MKIVSLLTVFLFLGITVCFTSPGLIDNSGKLTAGPGGKKIDRVVQLTETLRISDINDDFFFKRPRQIKVAHDGSIFVVDPSQVLLLKFNAKGKFIGNYLTMGQGPNELTGLTNCWLGKNDIVLSSFQPIKILHLDLEGKLKKEIRVTKSEFLYFLLGRFDGEYYFYHLPLTAGNGMVESDIDLKTVSLDGKLEKTDLKYRVKKVALLTQVKTDEGTNTSLQVEDITRFNFTYGDDRFLYTATDEKYLIRKTDLKTKKIVKEFRRLYPSVPFVPNPKDKFANSDRVKKLYKREFYTDIYGLLAVNDNIWVFTSTLDKNKGILVDVFSPEGKYIDRFYLKIPQLDRPDDDLLKYVTYDKGYLYIVQLNEEDNPSVVKYKIED